MPKVTQLQSDSHGSSPRKPRIKNSRARGIILPHSEEPEAQTGSASFPQTHSKAVGETGMEPAATQGPVLCSCHCSVRPRMKRQGLPASFSSSGLPIPPFVNTLWDMGVNNPGLTREIFLWDLPILWRASNPGERGIRSMAGNLCLAWPKRTQGPAPLPSAPAMMTRLLP